MFFRVKKPKKLTDYYEIFFWRLFHVFTNVFYLINYAPPISNPNRIGRRIQINVKLR